MSRYYRSLIQTVSLDADAQAFLTAASITDPTITAAIETLVIDLKAAGIWTKMKAVYPFVGGTASSHKFNLKDPRDLDAAFRLIYTGALTHNSNGMTGAGGRADTRFSPSANLTANSTSVGFYDGSEISSNSTEMGCSGASFLPIIGLSTRFLSNANFNAQFDCYDFSGHRLATFVPTSQGFTIGSVVSGTDQRLYKNGLQIGATVTTAQTQGLPSQNIFILARNDNGSASNISSKNARFSFIGDGLTAAEVADLQTAVQSFQTTLGRAV
jgi:hypothetical protein